MKPIIIYLEGGIVQDVENLPKELELQVQDFDIEGFPEEDLTILPFKPNEIPRYGDKCMITNYVGDTKNKHIKGYIAICKHDSDSDGDIEFFYTKEAAAEATHKFFESYGFYIKSGKAYDINNDFEDLDVFDNVEFYKGKVVSFIHCDGDGPSAEIIKNGHIG